jgi:dihydrolipoamide dehydrogenase
LVTTLVGKGAKRVSSAALFYAIGRRPNTVRTGIERTAIALDERGFLRVSESLETNVPGVFIVGDVNGRHLFTHAATVQNEYLADRLCGGRRVPLDPGHLPHAVFTEPEVGRVGETDQALKARKARYLKANVCYQDLPKGIALVRSTQCASARSVLHPLAPTKTKPLSGRPVKSIERACGSESVRS